MRAFNEVIFDGEVAGTTAVYSDAFFDPLLSVVDELIVQAVCWLVSGNAVALRVALEHSNDDVNWVTKCGIIGPLALSATAVVTDVGSDDSLVPTGAYARLRIWLSGDSPAATVRVTACARKFWTDSGVGWNADFTGITPGALATLPAGLFLSRASSATVQTSAVSLVTSGIGNDVPRVGDDGTHAGLVIEETRTNLIPNGRDLTAGSWTAGSGVTTTADAATGPDGTASIADRSEVSSGGFSNYDPQVGAGAGTYTMSQWHQRGSANALAQLALMVDSTASFKALGGLAPAYWQRVAVTMTHTSGDVYSVPAIGMDGTAGGGIAAGPRDVITDLVQLEVGKFATEAIVTSGGTATRSGERLYLSDVAVLLDAGRLSLEMALQPKGSGTQYATNPYVWYIDASNYALIDATTQKLSLSIGGTAYEFTTAMSWAAGDTVELWLEGGGGLVVSRCQYRVNGGTAVDLGSSGSAQGTIAGGVAIDLLAKAGSAQWSAWLRRVRAWRSGRRPAWVS